MMSNLLSEMIQSSKTPVRNHQHPPSMTVNATWERQIILIHDVKFDIIYDIILKNPVRNHQCPPSMIVFLIHI